MALKLIVGLGNPGAQYAQTRHNAGEWYVRRLADKLGVRLSVEPKYFGETASAVVAGEQVRLLIPATYMNRSGQAVGAMANFYRIAPQEILVAHDELDIPPGTLKLKIGGGHGGHNGLKDIVPALGNSADFYRLRIGIGHPGDREQVTGWVLGKAPRAEQEKMDAAIDEALRESELLIRGEFQKAQQKLHSFVG
ncbi:aminoacyl-tRNA hydrolase [Permianibacter sp. IMCC34836]|uniref:aminoacyl-tRNA hydrolase n=1 Tax=Permianibacter fluminis TaxID=2738515 RepID=UPI0015531331|nr:aminoacyl-tRNA hydrolase [Permianibacter fluminis]NQD36942.1 aminoacyl-tRNA hydrolase [Permianibacter fluminis]